MYPLNVPEEELKNRVAADFFSTKSFNHTKILGAVDFSVSYKDNGISSGLYFLWAEAKRGKNADIIGKSISIRANA